MRTKRRRGRPRKVVTGSNTTVAPLPQKDWKYYLTSAVITFIAGFSMGILPMLDKLDVQNITTATVLAVVLAGIRTGLSLLARRVVEWYNK